MDRKNTNKIKRIIEYFKSIKFKYINLSITYQAVIFLSIIGIISLFMPWIIDKENNISWNSFNAISGNIGFLLIIIYLVLIFVVFSSNYKEKLKLYADLNFKNHLIILGSGLASVFFGIIAVSFSNGLSTMGQSFVHGKGLILSMTTGILLVIFGLIIRNNYKKINSEIILEQLNINREKIKEKDNMTLPF